MVGTFGSDVLNVPDGAEVWVANEAHRKLGDRQPARVFQLHPRDWRESERQYLAGGELPEGLDVGCFGRNWGHAEYLRTCGVPVVMQQQWDDIPTCEVYPFEVVTASVGIPLPPDGVRRLWATSTFGYMAALLLAEHLNGRPVAELALRGIELPLGSWRERTWEWPNLAYYLGMAVGQGVAINLSPDGSSLLSGPHYAIGGRPHPGDPDHWWSHGDAHIIADPESGAWRIGSLRELVPVGG